MTLDWWHWAAEIVLISIWLYSPIWHRFDVDRLMRHRPRTTRRRYDLDHITLRHRFDVDCFDAISMGWRSCSYTFFYSSPRVPLPTFPRIEFSISRLLNKSKMAASLAYFERFSQLLLQNVEWMSAWLSSHQCIKEGLYYCLFWCE